MSEQQHERFVTGIVSSFVRVAESPAAVPGQLLYEHAAIVDLSTAVAAGTLGERRPRVDVPIVTTISAVRFSAAGKALGARISGVSATVVDGVAMVSVMVAAAGPLAAGDTLIDQLDVAWMVDTAGDPSTGR
jgi:hypothetical protein